MASTYLTRTYGNATSRKKCTISFWVKKGFSGDTQQPYCSYADNNNRFQLYFESSDELSIYNKDNGSDTIYLKSKAKYRDWNAWYHIYASVDTTVSTAADRVKIYVNGERVTEFHSSQNIPNQNSDLSFGNNAFTFNLGRYGGTGHHLNGVLSHFYFIDGSVVAHTEFGSTDTTTGEWKISTNPTISDFGNEGCKLFIDNNSVTDQSGKGNNMTVAAGTLTQTEDNPSNIFNTLNPLYRSNISGQNNIGFNHGYTTWYPSSASNTHSWGRSTLGWTSGKYYMEFKVEEAGGGNSSGVWMVPTELPNSTSPQGISDTAYGFQCQFSASDDNFYTVNGGSTVTTITSNVGSNPIIMMAIDADNNKMWLGHNGTWYNNNNASTTLNNSHPDLTWTPGTYGSMYQLAFQAWYQAGAYNNTYANFGNGYFGTTAISSEGTNASGIGKFEYDVPTGFTALSTKGLNE